MPNIAESLTDEADALDKLPELAATPFPHNGHEDFRGFTDEDYATFVAGLFQRADDPAQLKWLGGASRVDAARAKLESLGYKPHESECTMRGQVTLTFAAQGTFPVLSS